jgi:hypothetical protein
VGDDAIFYQDGDTVAYRCSDCGDRWAMVLDVEDFDD